MEAFAEGQVYLPVAAMIDLDKEKSRITSELEQLKKDRAGIDSRLSNEAFVSKAPAAVVEKERGRLREIEETMANLKAGAERLGIKI
mgnify:FL=1